MGKKSKMGSKTKLNLSFILLGTLASAIIVYAYFAASQFADDVAEVSREVFPETKIAIEVKGLVTNVVENFKAARAAASEENLPVITSTDEQIRGLLQQLGTSALLKKISGHYAESYKVGMLMVAASVEQEYEEESVLNEKFDLSNQKLLLALNNFTAASSTKHHDAMMNIMEVSSRMKTILLASLVMLVFLAGVIFIQISRMSGKLDEIAEGSADAALGLREAIVNISSMSVQLANEASSSSESLERILTTVQESSEQAEENMDAAETAEKASKDTLSTGEKASMSIKEVAEAMAEMVKVDHEISSLVQNISDIAFQTNLLALNAAVEAARAGEAGAGFAVVAEEVRNLALRTAGTSQEVDELIGRLDEKITVGERMVGELQAVFPEVRSASQAVVEQMTIITDSGRHQAEALGKMRQEVAVIEDKVQSQAAMSEEGSATVADVEAQVERLRLMIDHIIVFWNGEKRAHRQDKRPRISDESPDPHS